MWAAVCSFIAALLVSVFVPAVEKVKEQVYRCALCAIILFLVLRYFVVLKNKAQRKKLYDKAQFISACGITLAVWDLLTAKSALLPLPYFPSFAEITKVMFDDKKLLAISALYSLRLFFAGFITGAVLGITSGALIGWKKRWSYWLTPVIKVSGIIPAIAWLPIALQILPNSFVTGVFLIFMSSWFPVSSMMAAGIIATPRSYFEVAKTLGADEKYLLFHVAIPAAMPSLFTGIMTAAAFSFTTLIVSEMVGAKAGLGFYINWAKGWGVYSKVYGAIIIIAVEFSIIIALINKIKVSVLRWQRGILQ